MQNIILHSIHHVRKAQTNRFYTGLTLKIC